MFLAFFAVLCFCLCAHQFIKYVVTPLPRLNLTEFSKTALKLKKAYSVLSWGVMTATFLMAVAVSFYQVYTQL